MPAPQTPAVRLMHDIASRTLEAQVIGRLVDLAEDYAGRAPISADALRELEREQLIALLRGARAMLGDLAEDLGMLEDRALALHEAAPTRSATPARPAA